MATTRSLLVHLHVLMRASATDGGIKASSCFRLVVTFGFIVCKACSMLDGGSVAFALGFAGLGRQCKVLV